jgi:hypothetical protein
MYTVEFTITNDRATKYYLRILIVKTVIYQFFKLRLYAINTQPVTLSSDIGQESQPIRPRLVLAGCCVLGKQLHPPILCHPYIFDIKASLLVERTRSVCRVP